MIETFLGAVAEVAATERLPQPPDQVIERIEQQAQVLPVWWRPFARCVERRESHSNPRAHNPSGAAGLFQWMPPFRHGGPYIVARGLKAHGATAQYARKVRLALPLMIERWPERYQRIMFAQQIAEGGADAAYRHWNGGAGCNALIAW